MLQMHRSTLYVRTLCTYVVCCEYALLRFDGSALLENCSGSHQEMSSVCYAAALLAACATSTHYECMYTQDLHHYALLRACRPLTPRSPLTGTRAPRRGHRRSSEASHGRDQASRLLPRRRHRPACARRDQAQGFGRLRLQGCQGARGKRCGGWDQAGHDCGHKGIPRGCRWRVARLVVGCYARCTC